MTVIHELTEKLVYFLAIRIIIVIIELFVKKRKLQFLIYDYITVLQLIVPHSLILLQLPSGICISVFKLLLPEWQVSCNIGVVSITVISFMSD